MGKKYVYSGSSSSDDSGSESSSAPSARRYRRRERPSHKRAHSRPAPQFVAVAPQAAAAADADKKKKKAPKKPPQESIDQIWEKFSQKKFSKALSVLPFSPVAPSTSNERGNELLSAGYERAAEECSRKVRKIISECKRVNTRYRDPGWDLVSLYPHSTSLILVAQEAPMSITWLRLMPCLPAATCLGGTATCTKAAMRTHLVAPACICC